MKTKYFAIYTNEDNVVGIDDESIEQFDSLDEILDESAQFDAFLRPLKYIIEGRIITIRKDRKVITNYSKESFSLESIKGELLILININGLRCSILQSEYMEYKNLKDAPSLKMLK